MNPGWRGQYHRYKSHLLNIVSIYEERQDVRAYLEILLSLATISVFAIFALKPTLETIAELTKDLDSKESTITILENKIENLVKAENIFVQERPNIELLTQAIPSSPEPDVLLKQIQGVATQYPSLIITNFVIDSTVLVGKQPPKPIMDDDILPNDSFGLSFSLNAKADYVILIQFLADLELLLRPIIFDSISFTINETELGAEEIILVIGSKTPYLE